MFRPLHMLATCALGLALAAPALAEENPGVTSRLVPLSDLNLANEHGAGVALNRMTAAAHVVCDRSGSPLDLTNKALDKTCHREALGSAVDRLGAPLVTAAYERKAGKIVEIRTASR